MCESEYTLPALTTILFSFLNYEVVPLFVSGYIFLQQVPQNVTGYNLRQWLHFAAVRTLKEHTNN